MIRDTIQQSFVVYVIVEYSHARPATNLYMLIQNNYIQAPFY